MAMRTVARHAYPLPFASTNLGSFTQILVIDASGEKLAFIIAAPETGTITEVIAKSAAITNTTGVLSIETLDTSTGLPTGTLWAANTNGNYSYPTASAHTFRTIPLTAGAVVTKGQLLAVVFTWASGSIAWLAFQMLFMTNPYIALFTASWAKSAANMPILILNYGGSYYVPQGCYCGFLFGNVTFNSGSTSPTPTEVGNLYTPQVSQRVTALTAAVDYDGEAQLVVYDSAGNVLGFTTIYPGVRQANTGGGGEWELPAAITLLAGVQYRLAIKPTTTTNVIACVWEVPAAAGVAVAPGGTEFVYTAKVSGVWAETATRQAMIYPIIDGIDAGAGVAKLTGKGLVN